jgi:hypothetical protein
VHVLRVASTLVLPRRVESHYPFGEEKVRTQRTEGRVGGSFELDG